MKKITLMKNLATAAIFALAISSTVSCDPEENKKDDTTYSIELVNPLDSDIIFNDDFVEVYNIGITTNISKDALLVTPKEEQDWCSAALNSDGTAVVVTPGSNFTEEDVVASFVISSTIEGVTPVEFKITRRGTETEYTVDVTGEDLNITENWGTKMMSYYPTASSPKSLTLTITTNASAWEVQAMGSGYDDEDDETTSWYHFDKTSGRSGETLTVTFDENSSNEERMISLQISPKISGYGDSQNITINQDAKAATEATVYIDYNPIEGSEYTLNVPKEGYGEYEMSFSIEANGSVDVKAVNPGTSTVTEAQWISCTGSMGYYSIMIDENTTSAERKVDLIIIGKGSDTELFRFKVTQAAE